MSLAIVALPASLLFITLHITLAVFCVLGSAIAVIRYHPLLLRRRSQQHPTTLLPGITCIRPICGVDHHLRENLVSCIVQDYPLLEVLFCVPSPNDPALQVIQSVIDEYKRTKFANINPSLASKDTIRIFSVFTNERCVGINPKINNIVDAYDAATYDTVWILDSNTAVDPDTCKLAALSLQEPGIGLVHQLPIAVDAISLGSWMEQLFLSTAHARMYTSINSLKVSSCLLGKSNFFPKRLLQDVGGIKYFGKFMSEDQQIGVHIWSQGYRHTMTTSLVYQSLGESLTFEQYWLRRARWQSIRKYVVPVSTLVEPSTESILNSIAAFWGWKYILSTIITRKVILTLFPPIRVLLWIFADNRSGIWTISMWKFFLFQFIMFTVSDFIVFTSLQTRYRQSNVYKLFHGTDDIIEPISVAPSPAGSPTREAGGKNMTKDESTLLKRPGGRLAKSWSRLSPLAVDTPVKIENKQEDESLKWPFSLKDEDGDDSIEKDTIGKREESPQPRRRRAPGTGTKIQSGFSANAFVPSWSLVDSNTFTSQAEEESTNYEAEYEIIERPQTTMEPEKSDRIVRHCVRQNNTNQNGQSRGRFRVKLRQKHVGGIINAILKFLFGIRDVMLWNLMISKPAGKVYSQHNSELHMLHENKTGYVEVGSRDGAIDGHDNEMDTALGAMWPWVSRVREIVSRIAVMSGWRLVTRTTRGSDAAEGFLRTACAMYVLREACAIWIWLFAMVQMQVQWRGQTYKLRTDGTAIRV